MSKVLLEGLQRLEYRGYDSAGLAVLDQHGQLNRVRMQGKVSGLIDLVNNTKLTGCVGVAHTRWATHGKPCEENAHPHISHNEIALVHNGIIENHNKLREKLLAMDYQFSSQTDTEVAVHLIHFYYQINKDLLTAVHQAAAQMQGAFALGVIHRNHPNELIGIRRGSPLVVGIATHGHFIASDALALTSFAHSIIYLKEGDSVRLHKQQLFVFNANGESVDRDQQSLKVNSLTVTKGIYRHFMLKEIYEQPQALSATIGTPISLEVIKNSFGMQVLSILTQIQNIHIVACGTSYHAGLAGKYWLESLTNLPVQVEVASEYRYRDVVVPNKTLFVTISQSGETADTLAALQKAKSLNYIASLTLCNVGTSSLARESDYVFLTQAGVEIGVASTKAFTTQLSALLMLAVTLCKDNRTQNILYELKDLANCCEQALQLNYEISQLAKMFADKNNAIFLGRGIHYPIAMEGALKLKEISYIHAEAYPAGELKHGPLALVDKDMLVVAIAPNDKLLDKLKSNLSEISAREGQLIVFVDAAQVWETNRTNLIRLPTCGKWIAPIVYTIPLQLLAYHVAILKGTDVDQPRNLAKSVTVE